MPTKAFLLSKLDLPVACNSGRCMYSCAEEGGDREEDVEDALSNCPLSNVEGDLVYCEGKEVTTDEDKCGFQNSGKSDFIYSFFNRKRV